MKSPSAFRTGMVALYVTVLISCDNDEDISSRASVSAKQQQSELQPLQEAKKYSVQIVPEQMSVIEKKERFAYLLTPAVDEVHAELMKRYDEVSQSVSVGADGELIEALKKEYNAKDNQDLLKALKPHPKSIGLAQAALESAWGTSRFFREANNIFGVWSYDKDEPRIAASQKRNNKTIWVKKYPSIKAAVKDYYRILARGHAYDEFRNLKMKTSDPYELVKKLDRYSEKGSAYSKQLAGVIRYNKFDKYDL